jgi:hypothetical protein
VNNVRRRATASGERAPGSALHPLRRTAGGAESRRVVAPKSRAPAMHGTTLSP